MENAKRDNAIWVLVGTTIVVAGASAVRPHDYATWFFELMLGWIGVGVLVAIYPRMRFSGFIYYVCAAHMVVLGLGAHYTYEQMPLFNWLRDTLGLSRNHFDRVGHFMQGFTPALIVREVMLRRTGLQRGKALALVTVAVPLSFSAAYEIGEAWWAQTFYPAAPEAWLGMQGDKWDAQWDMCMALTGATVALVIFSRLHDRSMRALEPEQS